MTDETPRFDYIIDVENHGNLVVHRGADGEVVCFHSPLNNGAVRCSICDGGARVYI